MGAQSHDLSKACWQLFGTLACAWQAIGHSGKLSHFARWTEASNNGFTVPWPPTDLWYYAHALWGVAVQWKTCRAGWHARGPWDAKTLVKEAVVGGSVVHYNV